MKGWVGLGDWPIADGLPTQVVIRQLQLNVGQKRSPVKDQRSNHCATQITKMCCNLRHVNKLVTTSHFYQSAFYRVKASFCALTFYDRPLMCIEFADKIWHLTLYYLLVFTAAGTVVQAAMGGVSLCWFLFWGCRTNFSDIITNRRST